MRHCFRCAHSDLEPVVLCTHTVVLNIHGDSVRICRYESKIIQNPGLPEIRITNKWKSFQWILSQLSSLLTESADEVPSLRFIRIKLFVSNSATGMLACGLAVWIDSVSTSVSEPSLHWFLSDSKYIWLYIYIYIWNRVQNDFKIDFNSRFSSLMNVENPGQSPEKPRHRILEVLRIWRSTPLALRPAILSWARAEGFDKNLWSISFL